MKSIENLIVTTIMLLAIFFCLMHLHGCRPSEKMVSENHAVKQQEKSTFLALDSAFRSFKLNADSLDCWVFFDSYRPSIDTSSSIMDSPIKAPNVPSPSRLSTPHIQAVHLTAKNAHVSDDIGHKVEVADSTNSCGECKNQKEKVHKKTHPSKILFACLIILITGISLIIYRLKYRN